jgi:hypothetical protein
VLGSPALALLQQETVINTSIVTSSACFTKLNLDKKLIDELVVQLCCIAC